MQYTSPNTSHKMDSIKWNNCLDRDAESGPATGGKEVRTFFFFSLFVIKILSLGWGLEIRFGSKGQLPGEKSLGNGTGWTLGNCWSMGSQIPLTPMRAKDVEIYAHRNVKTNGETSIGLSFLFIIFFFIKNSKLLFPELCGANWISTNNLDS